MILKASRTLFPLLVLFLFLPAAGSAPNPEPKFQQLFTLLASGGAIDQVLNRSHWPRNDRVVSYLELELIFHPRFRTTTKHLKRFLKQWPGHPQENRVAVFLEARLLRTGTDQAVFSWFQRHPPRSVKGRIRYMRLLLDRHQQKPAWRLWRSLYRGGVRFAPGLQKQTRSFLERLTNQDHETRARVLLRRGQQAAFNQVLNHLPAKRRDYFKTLLAAHRAQKQFSKRVVELPPKDAADPELWWTRLEGLRRNGFLAKAMAQLLGPEGAYLTDGDRQRLRYRLGRDLLYWRGKAKQALQILRGNVREMGVKLQDSLWIAAWAAHRTGKDDQARRWFQELAKNAVTIRHRARGAYWAGRLATSKAKRKKWYRVAAGFPNTFYGLLAREITKGNLTPLADPPLRCSKFRDSRLKREINDLSLLKRVGRGYYNGGEIKRLAKRFSISLHDQLCLAQKLGAPDLAIRTAQTLDKQGERYWSGLYPVPDWVPMRGWKVDPSLIWAMVRQESLFYHRANSSAKAFGVMQLIPATARAESQAMALPQSNRFRLQVPRYNIAVGQSYMMRQLRDFNGDLILSLSAYNAGPGRGQRWLKRRMHEDPTTFIENIPITETRRYVKRILHGLAVYQLRIHGKISLSSAISRRPPGFILKEMGSSR